MNARHVRRALLALIAGSACMVPGPATAADARQAAGEKAKRPSIDVLLLGYYIWAKPEYEELCRKEGINIYGTMRKDPTGADPAN